MPLEPDFLTLMPHVVTVEGILGYDMHVEPVYNGNPKQYRARITGKFLSLRVPKGEEGTPIFDIYIGARWINGEVVPLNETDVFTKDDKLTLPPDPMWVDGTPVIFAVATVTEDVEGEHPDGARHHVKIQCGWRYHRQGQ